MFFKLIIFGFWCGEVVVAASCTEICISNCQRFHSFSLNIFYQLQFIENMKSNIERWRRKKASTKFMNSPKQCYWNKRFAIPGFGQTGAPWKTGFSHQVMSPGRSKIFSLRATFLSNCETKLGYCPSCHLGRYTPSPPYTSVSKRAVSRNR